MVLRVVVVDAAAAACVVEKVFVKVLELLVVEVEVVVEELAVVKVVAVVVSALACVIHRAWLGVGSKFRCCVWANGKDAVCRPVLPCSPARGATATV